jgi:hypothetical protein
MTETATGWESILDEDEAILWQGRPDGAIVLQKRNILTLLFGLLFSGIAVIWMIAASGAGGIFWMMGLLHFSAGLAVAFSAVFWGAVLRRHSWYTLTDRRAIIAADLPLLGKRLNSYPITESTVLELIDDPLATVNFAHKIMRSKKRSYTVPVGFERIHDGKEVYRIMRTIQVSTHHQAGSTGPGH